MLLDEVVQGDIYKLHRELTTYRVTELQREEAGVIRKLRNISRSGIYSNHTIAIQLLSSELSRKQPIVARLRFNVCSLNVVEA